MHPFLNTFIEKDFNNELELLKKTENISENYENWSAPALEIAGFDIQLIAKIKKMSELVFEQFVPLPGTLPGTCLNNNNWFLHFTSDEWKELLLLDNTNTNNDKFSYDFTSQTYNGVVAKNNTVSQQKDILNLCLFTLGINDSSIIRQLRIMTVEPGGYLHPHKDKSDEIRCVWMPLHKFDWCLKFFPFGWLKHELGKAYLINNTTYVHGVLNSSKERRYILNVDFFEDLSKNKLTGWHEQSCKTWKDIFTN